MSDKTPDNLSLENASLILRTELLAKILRIYDYFADANNRKVFEESGFNYAQISRTFQLNGIELEAIMSYVCKYSRSKENRQVCEVIARAREAKSDKKNQKRLDNNKGYVNDKRIKEIAKLFTDVFTDEGDIKGTNNEVLSNKDLIALKDDLLKAIAGINPNTIHTPVTTSQGKDCLKETIPEQNKKEAPPKPLPEQKVPAKEEPQKIQNEDVNKALEKAMLRDIDEKPKMTKKSRNLKIIYIALGVVATLIVSMVFIARLLGNQNGQNQQLALPANLTENVAVPPKDEKTTIREKVQEVKVKEQPNNGLKLDSITPPQQAILQEKPMEAEKQREELEQQKEAERDVLIQMQRQEQARVMKQRRESYTESDVRKQGVIKNGTLLIGEDVFNVNDVLGKSKVLSIHDDYLDVLDIKDGYPFKIFIK